MAWKAKRHSLTMEGTVVRRDERSIGRLVVAEIEINAGPKGAVVTIETMPGGEDLPKVNESVQVSLGWGDIEEEDDGEQD